MSCPKQMLREVASPRLLFLIFDLAQFGKCTPTLYPQFNPTFVS
jgi:hypothetical protein